MMSDDNDRDYEDCYEDDENEDFAEAYQDYSKTESVPYTSPSVEVITKESLLAAQGEDIWKVMDWLSLREHQARSLLMHYRWDVEKLLELFAEEGRDQLYATAGVKFLDHDDFPCSSTPIQCGICFDEASASEVTAMDCGHFFCNECWTQHFMVKIVEGQSRRIRCMEPKCNVVCDDEKIRSLVGARDPGLADKFDRFLLESYIEDNRRVKWCPSIPHCGNALRVENGEICEVECACGVSFCFSCLSQPHSPCSCRMWELWSKKCKDESETANWIAVHTKPCPKCGKAVEKNGGCNWVQCVCGQAFCWLCGGATGQSHGGDFISGHSCGIYNDELVKKKEEAKMYLDRFVHYNNRYEAHLDSLKLESNLEESIQDKISKLDRKVSSSKDFTWIMNGLYILSRSRHMLSLTYAFAYYMFGDELFKNEMTREERDIKKNLFEQQQQQFEANVEKLSMFLEEKFDEYEEDKVRDLRMRIIAVSESTDNLCRNLYDCIENDLLGSLDRIAPYKSIVC